MKPFARKQLRCTAVKHAAVSHRRHTITFPPDRGEMVRRRDPTAQPKIAVELRGGFGHSNRISWEVVPVIVMRRQ